MKKKQKQRKKRKKINGGKRSVCYSKPVAKGQCAGPVGRPPVHEAVFAARWGKLSGICIDLEVGDDTWASPLSAFSRCGRALLGTCIGFFYPNVSFLIFWFSFFSFFLLLFCLFFSFFLLCMFNIFLKST